MKKQDSNKKRWITPFVSTLNIKKDTFSGSGSGPEDAGKDGPPTKI